MATQRFFARLLTVCICATSMTVAMAADEEAVGERSPSVDLVANGAMRTDTLPRFAPSSAESLRLRSPAIQRFADAGSVAGVPGTVVYRNEISPITHYHPPVANRRMAEDLELASGSCDVVSYTLAVYGEGTSGPTFDVQVALWDGDPCEPGSSMIPGTDEELINVPNDRTVRLLDIPLGTAVQVPGVVWLAATFSTSDSGWIVAEESEIGYTRDLFSRNDPPSPYGEGCTQFRLSTELYAGFWAKVSCELPFGPPGACCDAATCAEVTEADCTSGVWLGAFTTCDPNPCQPGACCTGEDYTTCADTTEAQCAAMAGLFHAATTCAAEPCQPQFYLYENNGASGVFVRNDYGTFLADDQVTGNGAPCKLSSFDIQVFGSYFTDAYDVSVELWTVDEENMLPGAPITGTATQFRNVRDGAVRTLTAGPFLEDVELRDQVWMVMSTSTNESGWVVSGQATVGFTDDYCALYSDNLWEKVPPETIWWGFGANLRCYGIGPTGACCTDASGTCIDGVTENQCDGRWASEATCDSNPFVPPCGSGACCTLLGGCIDTTPDECETLHGEIAPLGSFCSDVECPRAACIDATGDCYTRHDTPGCEDGFCCETVCWINSPGGDSYCCTHEWDEVCAQTARSHCLLPLANDHCADAEAIEGEGDFDFDNTAATTDGPPHANCSMIEGDEQTIHDVWYCWTAPCTETVYIQTCGLTDVDTKLNVYEGCGVCPPTDSVLVTCNDDFCGYDPNDEEVIPAQSQVSFDAAAGQNYLIRVGTFPGGTIPDYGVLDPAEGGPGRFRIICGIPDNVACPGPGDCFTETGTPGCLNESCCDTVCACDAFCCEVEWDGDCGATGYQGSGCGAEVHCGGDCPRGQVQFTDPPSGVVDARQPHPPSNPSTPQGIGTLQLEAPQAADNLDCWTLCETAVEGVTNDIMVMADNDDGTFTITLVRPISTRAVTTITYTDDGGVGHRGVFTSHPANVNADSRSAPSDILRVIDYINGVATSPWGIYSEDVDHSDMLGPPDILRVIDLLNGAGQFDPWLNTTLPDCGVCCPQ